MRVGRARSRGELGSPSPSPSPSPTGVPTLAAITLPPPPPPTGRLLADLRQSSRDVALGRMEVWLGNDTVRGVTPTAIRYDDPRFHGPLAGGRLRLDPSRSERGYPLPLPPRPACGVPASAPGARPTVTVTYAVTGRPGTRRVTLPVGDDNDVVARYAAARCLELAVARVAPLSFADDGAGLRGRTDRHAHARRPAPRAPRPRAARRHGRRHPAVQRRGPLGLGPAHAHPRRRAALRVRLRVQPARCDDHVFMEAAGATAFLVGLRLDGRPGELVVRMSPAGTSAAISFARSACGL